MLHSFTQPKSSHHAYVRMTEKRRGVSTQVALFIVCLTVIFLLWHHSGCPGPPESTDPSYLLILPSNVSQLPPPYRTDVLPPNDKTQLIDLYQFQFLINNPICNDSDPLVLVLVHSDPRNVIKRTAIRETWGSQFKVIFLVGIPKSEGVQRSLLGENDIHHDFVQGNFLDAYRNMTYKHVMGLKWTTYFCPGARYILKTDDDVFVNPTAVRHYIATRLSPYGARRLILCQAFPFAYVQRSYRSKWRVSFSEYRGDRYPSYCPGWVIMYSPDAVFELYKESQSAQYFWIDDVFVTGLMASRANIPRSKLNTLVLTGDRFASLLRKAPHEDFFLFGPSDLTVQDIYKLWNIVTKWGDLS